MSPSTPAAPPPARAAGRPCCVSCGSARLRRSRFRLPDVLQLATLRWPVRCLDCGRRQSHGLLGARLAQSSRTPHTAAEPNTGRLQKANGSSATQPAQKGS